MKKLIVIIFAAVASISAMAQGDGVKWSEGTLDELKAQAVKAEKLIFIDFYATWCGPCQKMAKDVFPTTVVGEAINDFFVSAKVDVESTDGKKLAKKYNVTRYPTLMIIDPTNGKELGQFKPMGTPEAFAENVSATILEIANQ